ncbi:hypothetical protein D3C71_1094960 [compost metagenome]
MLRNGTCHGRRRLADEHSVAQNPVKLPGRIAAVGQLQPLLGQGTHDPDGAVAVPKHAEGQFHRLGALRDKVERLGSGSQGRPARIFSVADHAAPSAILPTLALPVDGGADALALGVRFLMRPDHHQQAIDQVHRLGFQAGSAVLAAVAGRNHGDPGIDDLRQLRLYLNGLGTAQAVQAFHDQHRPGRDPAIIDSCQEDAQGAFGHVALVIGRQALILHG